MLVSLPLLHAAGTDNEFRAWNELSYAFHSGFYPAAISQADEFISSYPRSTLIEDAQTLKGESLFMLGRYAEAEVCLERPAVRNTDASYWLGRSRFALSRFRDAADAFYASASLAGTHPADLNLYRSTLVYAAFSLSGAGDREQAASLLQYVFSHYSLADELVPSAALLFSLYQSLGNDEATVALYSQLENTVLLLQDDLREAIQLSAARSFSVTGNREKAWELYSGLITDGSQAVMLEALQEAYALSAEQGDYDVSPLLEGVESKLADWPEYRAEMWLRLGIASFEQDESERASVFFDRAEQTATREQKNLAAIYRSEMFLEQGDSDAGFELLEATLFTESPWYRESLLQLARCAAFSGKDRTAAAFIQKLEFALSDADVMNADEVFWGMWAAARNGSWNAVLSLYGLMPEKVVFPEAAALYGNALLVTSPGEEAAEQAAAELERSGDVYNACVAFLLSGQYDRVLSDTEGCTSGTDISYLRGLALLTKGRWTEAVTALGTDNPWALYYTAYALYRSGDTRNAYTLFTRFINENPVHKMTYEANLTAALCALQNGHPELALAPAERAGAAASTEARRIEAHLQCSLIYKDLNRLSDAIKVLEQDMNSYSRISVPLKYQLADLYAEAGRLSDADALLVKTESLLSGTQMAEETAFRRAELYFARGLWNEAAARFSACRKNYPSGSAAERALYYNALCCENGGNADSAILMFEACRSHESAGLYTYSCLEHLIPLYRASGEVNTALRLSETAVADFPKEAAQAGIPEMMAELKLLAEGADEKTARLLSRFNAAGGTASVEGRAAGAELARQYLDLYSKWDQGVQLLQQIAAAIPSDADYDDMNTGALTYSLLGRCWRQTDELEQAVEAYLSAARYGAPVSAEETAHALYCAAEAADAAGYTGDASFILKQMMETYPRSPWTARASALLGL